MRMSGRTSQSAAPGQLGFTLLEVLVSLTLGILLLLGLGTLLARQSSARAELDKAAAQLENGRYAMSVLKDNLMHAGFYGQFGDALDPPAALPNPCSVDLPMLRASLALAVQAYDAPASVPSPLSDCLPAANHVPGTDILVVRRAASAAVLPTLATMDNDLLYLQATPASLVLDIGDNKSAFTLTNHDAVTPAPIHRYLQYIFFVSPCKEYAPGNSVCTAQADSGDPVPTLKRLEIAPAGGAATHLTVPVAEGIEDLQIDWGVAGAADAAPKTPFVTDPGLADWPNAMAAHVHILARSVQRSPGHSDGKQYAMGQAGVSGPFADAYKRHQFASAIRLVNMSARRE